MSAQSTRSRKQMKWRTLLTGRLRKEAEETLREIAAELADRATSVSAGEAANLGLFFGYLAEAFQRDGQEEVYAEYAFAYLNDAIRRAPTEIHQPFLCGGYAGLGWVIAKL